MGGGLKCQLQQWMRDLKRLQQGAPPGDDDIRLRNAIIVGLGGTLFDGAILELCSRKRVLLHFLLPQEIASTALLGIFKLTLKFTKEYTVKPPVVPFVSRMFHCNTANQQAATMLTGGRIDYYKKAQRIVELSWKAI
ncbi:hypothetical protein WN944_005488 [Citrus x changshan-huyou]|uniref:Uncharacterized protein n=1 Tax=Citrus x changshan-huyou TaxID=2935761 RepID=A0AAP0M3W3_9ROSI